MARGNRRSGNSRKTSIEKAAGHVISELTRQAKPAGVFDASRYFRAAGNLVFLNVRTATVRALARATAHEHREDWSVREALAFADLLVRDERFEVKGVGIETLARFRRQFLPKHLTTWKRWLSDDYAANWATTDSMCGSLISPLLMAHPELVATVTAWSRHRNMWVRRAAAVSLVRLAARGLSLDAAYGVASALLADRHDLIHKATGWLLREAGRTDRPRLKRYLTAHGPSIPRTAVRYAIEHFPPAERRELLAATRAA
jgi:3-methyladenine DNA glycosylase AlkD